MSTEVSVEGLRQNVAAAQQDVNRSLGELQDLLIAQREATHSLEKELMAYKLDTEARLTEDAKRMATLDRQVQTLGGTVEPHVSNESVALRLQARAARGERARRARARARGAPERARAAGRVLTGGGMRGARGARCRRWRWRCSTSASCARWSSSRSPRSSPTATT